MIKLPTASLKCWQEWALALLVLGLGGLAIAAPIIQTGSWFYSHDGMRYPYLAYRFREAIGHGILYPRWMPELMAGYGYPTFIFYQPGYFFFAAIFASFMDAVHTSWTAIGCMMTLGAVGAYKLARYYMPCGAALILALVFQFSPYHGVNLYIRGDLSELFSMLMCPWSVYFGIRMGDALRAGEKPHVYFAGLVFFGLIGFISHPFVTFFYMPFLGILLLYRAIFPTLHKESILLIVLALALVVVLATPYWLPMLQLKELVHPHLATAGPYSPLSGLRPFERYFIPNANKPAYTVFMLLMYFGLILGRNVRELRLVTYFYVFYLFLMTDFSRPIWEHGYAVLRYIQFPWRVRSVTATLEFLAFIPIGVLIHRLYLRNRYYGVAAALALLAAVMSVTWKPYAIQATLRTLLAEVDVRTSSWPIFKGARYLTTVDYYNVLNERESTQFISMQGPEFNPRHMRLSGLPNRLADPVPIAELDFVSSELEGNVIEVQPESTIYRYKIKVKLEDEGGIIINQVYFPGWKIIVNGKPVIWEISEDDNQPEHVYKPSGFIGPNGRIWVRLPGEEVYEIEAWYDGPPGWESRNLIVALLAALLLAAYRWRHRILNKLGARA